MPKSFLTFILLLTGTGIFAQNLTKSPYSRFGIGEPFFQGFSDQMGMGQLTQAYRDPLSFSVMNPASYSALQKTNFQFAAFGDFGTFSDGNSSQEIFNGSMRYLTLAFQLNKKKDWGAAFGLMPYSATGYNIINKIDSTANPYEERYEGRGGINRVFLGSGKSFGNHLSIGANASFLFGKNDRSEELAFPANSAFLSYKSTESNYITGFMFEAGTQLVMDSSFFGKSGWFKKNRISHIVGLSYTLSTNLNIDRQQFSRTFKDDSDNELIRDTLSFVSGQKGKVTLPPAIAAGYMFAAKNGKWKVGAEFRTTFWSLYKADFSNETFSNENQYSVGGSFLPALNLSDPKDKFFLKRTEYRLGMRYNQTRLNVAGQPITELGINVGFGFPLSIRTVNENFRFETVYSRLNINVDYMVRGTVNNNLIREEYYRITVGLSLNDKWFNKRKIE